MSQQGSQFHSSEAFEFKKAINSHTDIRNLDGSQVFTSIWNDARNWSVCVNFGSTSFETCVKISGSPCSTWRSNVSNHMITISELPIVCKDGVPVATNSGASTDYFNMIDFQVSRFQLGYKHISNEGSWIVRNAGWVSSLPFQVENITLNHESLYRSVSFGISLVVLSGGKVRNTI